MKTVTEQIEHIFSPDFQLSDDPSLEEQIAADRESIRLIAQKLDQLINKVETIHEWKLQKEGI